LVADTAIKRKKATLPVSQNPTASPMGLEEIIEDDPVASLAYLAIR
jgi:hypothetical protein